VYTLGQVMKMYGPDEETTVEAATSRTSLSGWCAHELMEVSSARVFAFSSITIHQYAGTYW